MSSFIMRARKLALAAGGLIAVAALGGCNGSDGAPGAGAGPELGRDVVTGSPAPVPADGGAEPVPGSPNPHVGPSCVSGDGDRICLALRYVVYEKSGQDPVVSMDQAIANLDAINRLWSACGIAFQIDEYLPVDPADAGLSFNTPTSSEIGAIRSEYMSQDKLLVATTGTWSGSLGAGSANAWTTMPGGNPHGVVLEAPVGNFGNIIAHELGHYLNLDHYSSSSNVMNAIIYEASTSFTQAQCNAARSAAKGFWSAMLRS